MLAQEFDGDSFLARQNSARHDQETAHWVAGSEVNPSGWLSRSEGLEVGKPVRYGNNEAENHNGLTAAEETPASAPFAFSVIITASGYRMC